MAASTISTAYKGGASAIDQTQQRSVEDTIRDLFPAYSLYTALVARGQSKNGQPVESKGMITKRPVTNRRYENYTYTPLAIEFTVVTLSSTTLTLASSTGLVARMTVFNTKNGTTAQIDSVTSTTVVEVTSFGTTAFSAAVGDVVIAMAPAYEQYSSTPAILSKNEDQIFNMLQRIRFSVAIDAVESQTPRHIAGNYWKRMKEMNIREGKRKMESTLLFSHRAAAAANGTAGGAVVGATNSFETTEGAFNWSANSMDCGGAMTPEVFRKELPKKFSNGIVGPDDRVIMFCGAEINGQVQEWANDRQIMIEDGAKDIVGIKTKAFQTSQFKVEVVMHDLFNRGSMQNKAFLFVPDNCEYVYFKGEDMRPESDIQNPSVDGFQDEWKGSVGFGTKDAGQSMLTVSNWY